LRRTSETKLPKAFVIEKEARLSFYVHMIAFKPNEFDVAAATTVEEAKQLLAAGFEKADEFQNIHLYKRPKRFND
jgi:hypothetical protein